MSGQDKKSNWRSLFVKEPVTETQPLQSQNSTPPVTIPNTAQQMANTIAPAGIIDEALIAGFEKSIEEKNLPGPDYYEYRNAVQKMAELVHDEATRYKVAFVTLQGQGLSVEKMVDNVESHYIPIVQAEQDAFNEAMETNMQNAVIAQENRIQELTSANEEKRQQLTKLTEEIQSNLNEIANLQGEVATNRSKIESRKATFLATFDKYVSDLRNDIQKIKTYLS